MTLDRSSSRPSRKARYRSNRRHFQVWPQLTAWLVVGSVFVWSVPGPPAHAQTAAPAAAEKPATEKPAAEKPATPDKPAASAAPATTGDSAASTASASGGTTSVFAAKVEALCAKVKPAFVFIAGGSGVVISPEGLMLTNTHVIETGAAFDVRLGNGRHYKAKVLGRDVWGDLALLQLEAKDKEPFPYLELGDSDALRIGEPAMAIGNPFGLGVVDQHPTFTVGIISAVRQSQGRYTECITTDAEVNPGNSGGPLVNMAGQVVGINGQISTRWGLRSNTGLGYAISARQVRMWLEPLKAAKGGNVEHGMPFGLRLRATRPDAPGVDDGLVVEEVAEKTVAAEAGFLAKDVIVKWDGLPVPNTVRWMSIVGMYPAGAKVPVDVRRGDQSVTLQVTLGELARSKELERMTRNRRPQRKPDGAKPENKPGDSKPDSKPGESKPDSKPGDNKPEAKPGESKPNESKPESKPSESKPEDKPDAKPDGSKP